MGLWSEKLGVFLTLRVRDAASFLELIYVPLGVAALGDKMLGVIDLDGE